LARCYRGGDLLCNGCETGSHRVRSICIKIACMTDARDSYNAACAKDADEGEGGYDTKWLVRLWV